MYYLAVFIHPPIPASPVQLQGAVLVGGASVPHFFKGRCGRSHEVWATAKHGGEGAPVALLIFTTCPPVQTQAVVLVGGATVPHSFPDRCGRPTVPHSLPDRCGRPHEVCAFVRERPSRSSSPLPATNGT